MTCMADGRCSFCVYATHVVALQGRHMPARVGAITRGDQRRMQGVRAPQIMGAHLICHVKYINIFMCNVTFETAI